jgi:hypothetical protein
MGLKWCKNKIKETPYQFKMEVISYCPIKEKLMYRRYLEKLDDKMYKRINDKTSSNISWFSYRYWSSDWKNITGYSINNFLRCRLVKK